MIEFSKKIYIDAEFGTVLLGVVLVLILVSFLVCSFLPSKFIITSTLVSLPFIGLGLIIQGLLTDIFNPSDESIKTLLLNNGGSPQINLKLSNLPLTRYIAYILFFFFTLAVDWYYGNILNTAKYMFIGDDTWLKFTYGLIIGVFLLLVLILRYSTLGFKLKNIFKLFFTIDSLKFFLEGSKIPGVLQKNFFLQISSSHWYNVSKNREDVEYLIVNKNEEYKYLLLGIHKFFFAFGRLLQVLIHILLWTIALFSFIFLIITLIILIFNYIDSEYFGDNAYSFYDVFKNKINWTSTRSTLSFESLHSKLIVSSSDLNLSLEHNTDSALENKNVTSKSKGEIIRDFVLCNFVLYYLYKII